MDTYPNPLRVRIFIHGYKSHTGLGRYVRVHASTYGYARVFDRDGDVGMMEKVLQNGRVNCTNEGKLIVIVINLFLLSDEVHIVVVYQSKPAPVTQT